jgi:hypothetical protein
VHDGGWVMWKGEGKVSERGLGDVAVLT